jgi:AcrR family transcriptional regulator
LGQKRFPRGAAAAPDTRPPRFRLGERERQIYVAASRLFVEKGFDGASMNDIAAAVNITKAGLYHFVESKEQLLFTITRFGMDELEEAVMRPARGIAEPGERLRAIFRSHVENAGRAARVNGNPLAVVVDDLGGLTAEHRKEIDERKRAYLELLRGTLEELAVAGRLRPGLDATAASFAAIGAIMWVARWWRPDGRLGLEETADQIATMLIAGVLQRDAA